jgi:hypothetical protein
MKASHIKLVQKQLNVPETGTWDLQTIDAYKAYRFGVGISPLFLNLLPDTLGDIPEQLQESIKASMSSGKQERAPEQENQTEGETQQQQKRRK